MEEGMEDGIRDGIRDGYYMDLSGKIVKVPLGATATPDKRGFVPITETTVQGTSIPVSTDPGVNDLLHKDTNNFDTTFHNVDPAQYFNVQAIDDNGQLDLNELHDLFPPIKLADPPFKPSYANSVLFSALSNKHPSIKYEKEKEKYAANADATIYNANDVKTVYHKSGVST
jgi:hypothetical protein